MITSEFDLISSKMLNLFNDYTKQNKGTKNTKTLKTVVNTKPMSEINHGYTKYTLFLSIKMTPYMHWS